MTLTRMICSVSSCKQVEWAYLSIGTAVQMPHHLAHVVIKACVGLLQLLLQESLTWNHRITHLKKKSGGGLQTTGGVDWPGTLQTCYTDPFSIPHRAVCVWGWACPPPQTVCQDDPGPRSGAADLSGVSRDSVGSWRRSASPAPPLRRCLFQTPPRAPVDRTKTPPLNQRSEDRLGSQRGQVPTLSPAAAWGGGMEVRYTSSSESVSDASPCTTILYLLDMAR